MRFVSLVTSTIGKARRAVTQGLSIGTSKEASTVTMAEQMRQVMLRVNRMEAALPPEATEFEVNVGAAGALVELRHNTGGLVRWWVTQWIRQSSTVATVAGHSLVEDPSSNLDTLFLKSYVTGRAVIRVEPTQFGLEPR
jgi:hypothetical protein